MPALDRASRLRRYAHHFGLLAILVAAASLAVVWVFVVPIYQAPDEPLHLDYALAIREHGGLFRVHHTSWDELPETVHPYTTYLMEATQARPMILNPNRRVLPDYGSRAFYASLAQGAPSRQGLQIDTPNKPFVVYPFGYYGLLALWITFLHQFNDGPVFTFFGARLLSVPLLVVSLFFVNATARRLNFSPWAALLLTVAIGLFPLTSFVASSVQPDNLSFTLVSVAFYLAVCARRNVPSARLIGLLGLTLGALLITKQHFFLCVLLSTAAMLATRMAGVPWRRRLAFVALFLLPSLLTGSLYLWTTWGCISLYGPAAPSTTDAWLQTLQGFKRASLDYYAGTTHDSFWGVFGWLDTPLVIRGPNTTEAVQFVLQVFAWLILALSLLRLERVGSRLLRLARRGRRGLALRLAFAEPLLNSYFLFTIFMYCIYIRIDNRFGAQGRNWWPLLLPTFLVGLRYAPKVLTLRWSRSALAAMVLGGLVLYSVVGSYYALHTLEQRYYGPGRTAQVGGGLAVMGLRAEDGNAQASRARHTLKAEEVLIRGTALRSENGAYELLHRDDGNVLLHRLHQGEGPELVWQTNTAGRDTTHLMVQPDGNLVLYHQTRPIWNSGTYLGRRHLDVKLHLGDDGNLVILHDGTRIWSSEQMRRDRLRAGERLDRGQALRSPSGVYTLIHQADGNVVLYRRCGEADHKVLWQTRTDRQPTTHLVLQRDGNLVLYDEDRPVWAALEKPRGKQLPVELRLQDDGNLVLYENGQPLWLTDTLQSPATAGR